MSELRGVLELPYWRLPHARVVVAALEASGKSLRRFAREHGVSAGRLKRWRRRVCAGQLRRRAHAIRDFWLITAWGAPGRVPRFPEDLRMTLGTLIIPPRRSERSYPRHVKIKMSNYKRKRGTKPRAGPKGSCQIKSVAPRAPRRSSRNAGGSTLKQVTDDSGREWCASAAECRSCSGTSPQVTGIVARSLERVGGPSPVRPVRRLGLLARPR